MTTTHPEEALLLAAVLDQPDDDTIRPVYADWLEEHGRLARAEFIRVQCELACIATPGDITPDCFLCNGESCRVCQEINPLKLKAFRHLNALASALFVLDGWEPRRTGSGLVEYWAQGSEFIGPGCAIINRGFVESVTCTAADWLAHGGAILAQHPIEQIHLPDFRVEIDPPGLGHHGWQIYYYELDLDDCIASSLGLASRADMVARLMADVRDLVAEFA